MPPPALLDTAVPGGPAVRPVRTRRDRARFVALPYELYRNHPHWVGPLRRDQHALLDTRRNAFFAHGAMELFLAEDTRGRVVGRVAAIENGRHLAVHGDATGFFGFFEVAESETPRGLAVAHALLDAAEGWLRGRGLARAVGPASPTLHDTSGLLVGGFDRPPAVMMPYNPPAYEGLLLGHGYCRVVSLFAYHAAWRHLNLERLQRGAALVRGRYPALRLRVADARHYDAELAVVQRLYAEVFADEWGFVPLTDAEFAQMARAMRPVIDPRLVLFLEAEGRPVGFSFSLPDVNLALRHVRDGRLTPANAAGLAARLRLGAVWQFRTVLLGVVPDWRRRGLDALLALETIEAGRAAGYPASELGWVMAHNRLLVNAIEAFGGVVEKEYALFEKAI